MKLTLTAGPPAYGGYTIAHLDGKVVMLKGAIPGEVVEAEVFQEKKDYSVAATRKVLEYSPERVEPLCRYFSACGGSSRFGSSGCGGCQMQYASYSMQVRIKEDVLASALKRIGKMEVSLSEPLTGKPFNYRYRGQFKLAGGMVGYFKERSNDIIDINRCPLMAEDINEVFINAKRLLKDTDAAELRIGRGAGNIALIKAQSSTREDWKDISARLMGQGFAGVRVEVEGKKPLLFGDGKILLELDGLKYEVSVEGFFQANWGLNRALVSSVIEALRPLAGKTVLDLYSGAGNFSLPVSRLVRKVVAVEESKSSVGDGNNNLKINGIDNCRFIRSGIDGFRADEKFDIVIADPPRAGISLEGIGKILSILPERIAYVSCNPATFARDLNRLQKEYSVDSVRLADFFPQTYHIEAVAILSRRPRS